MSAPRTPAAPQSPVLRHAGGANVRWDFFLVVGLALLLGLGAG